MPAALSAIAAKDGTSTTVPGGILAVDKSGANTGPFMQAQTIVDTQGVNTATVKAASTAVAAGDTAISVGLHPSSPLPAGSAVIGSLTANQSVNLAQIAGATTAVGSGVQATALRTTLATDSPGIIATGTAGAASAVVLTVQGVTSMTPVITKENKSATGTQSIVASSATSVTVLASNANRLGATVFNDSTQILYLLLTTGGTASTTVYTVQMAAASYYEVPFGYTGALIGIWASANGNARVMEMT